MSSAAAAASFAVRLVCARTCGPVAGSAFTAVALVLPVTQPNSASKFLGRLLFLRANVGHGALN